MNLPSWKAVGLRTVDVLELGHRPLNVSVACQCCALLSHFLTAYYRLTVVDSCSITRSHVFFFYFYLFLLAQYPTVLLVSKAHCSCVFLDGQFS